MPIRTPRIFANHAQLAASVLRAVLNAKRSALKASMEKLGLQGVIRATLDFISTKSVEEVARYALEDGIQRNRLPSVSNVLGENTRGEATANVHSVTWVIIQTSEPLIALCAKVAPCLPLMLPPAKTVRLGNGRRQVITSAPCARQVVTVEVGQVSASAASEGNSRMLEVLNVQDVLQARKVQLMVQHATSVLRDIIRQKEVQHASCALEEPRLILSKVNARRAQLEDILCLGVLDVTIAKQVLLLLKNQVRAVGATLASMQTPGVPLVSLVRLERRALTQGIRVMIALQDCTHLSAPALVFYAEVAPSQALIYRPVIPVAKAGTPLLGIRLALHVRREPTRVLGLALAAFAPRGR
mmetsp:Transcript_530/g.852  ORF Transcript_530/g.852 Transcript_530/m.852 type:complete len:356 (+) Transcript_530:1645-2712(+)